MWRVGCCSRDVLEELLAREAADGVHLSHLLTRDEIVSDQDLTAAVASELGVPFVDLAEQSILPDVWGLVPEDLARGYLAVALERRPTVSSSSWRTPATTRWSAALEDDLGMPILPAVAVRDDLVRLVEPDVRTGRRPVVGRRVGAVGQLCRGRPGCGVPCSSMRLLAEVVRVGGSDLHLTVGSPPVVRVQGELRRMPGQHAAQRLRGPPAGARAC